MKLHRFNPDGVAAFATYRARLTLEPTLPPPVELLEDPALTELLPREVEVAKRLLASDRKTGAEDIQWALLNSVEFIVNH